MSNFTSLAVLALVACSGGSAVNPVEPRLIAGGGIADGPIDGALNVYVIDAETDAPLANVRVHIGDSADGKLEDSTDELGLVVFGDVSGPQNVSIHRDGYLPRGWIGVNGANVTIPMWKVTPSTAESAMLSGTIPSFDTVQVPNGHLKQALVFQSLIGDTFDARNQLEGSVGACFQAGCNWSLTAHTGPVTLTAVILDIDDKGTPSNDDDVVTPIAWATRPSITVQAGVAQSGLTLSLIEPGNLQQLTVDLGTPPAGLPRVSPMALIPIDAHQSVRIVAPQEVGTRTTTVLAPKPSVFGGSSYRLFALADVDQTNQLGFSMIDRLSTTPALSAGSWMAPPANLAISRTSAQWSPSDGAKRHRVTYSDASSKQILDLTVFDETQHTVIVPAFLQPSIAGGGALTGYVVEIATDADPTSFSGAVEADNPYSFGVQATPVP